ncbi:hypothetical protein SARC_11641 [Sphaeroforma arctica JP610]|uniref:C2H2-type domain-containing protein n=1 Tax=Sphaeroforma arctica JP610 TaxID=667725 RepID=A0A0L0FIG7_9EUKA|nr:hypothetical protein SARC_11641 [Sphaeroforma arctica JP610]KNC75838.1 hypothetical protein SARC_11641 [Sphaeroforma arctica JP610]|eukprot:XP_014149740.1 hypothetical protein SARC_11641 [Sphaeroforma arctica JP610]
MSRSDENFEACCVCGSEASSMCQCALRLYCGRECQEYDWRTQVHYIACPSEKREKRAPQSLKVGSEIGGIDSRHIPEKTSHHDEPTRDDDEYKWPISTRQYRRTSSASQGYTNSSTSQNNEINGESFGSSDSQFKSRRRSTLPAVRYRPYDISPSVEQSNRIKPEYASCGSNIYRPDKNEGDHRQHGQLNTEGYSSTSPSGEEYPGSTRKSYSYEHGSRLCRDGCRVGLPLNSHNENIRRAPSYNSPPGRRHIYSDNSQNESHPISNQDLARNVFRSHNRLTSYTMSHRGGRTSPRHSFTESNELNDLTGALPTLVGEKASMKVTAGYTGGEQDRQKGGWDSQSNSLSCAELSLESTRANRRRSMPHNDTTTGIVPQAIETDPAKEKDPTAQKSDKPADNSFICKWEGCGKVCRSIGGLVRHTHHHSNRPRIFPVDANVYPYICQWNGCAEKFKHVSDLNQHAAMHATVSDARLRQAGGEKPQIFKCSFKGCGKLCRSVGGLKQHSAVHKAEVEAVVNNQVNKYNQNYSNNAKEQMERDAHTKTQWRNRSSCSSQLGRRNLQNPSGRCLDSAGQLGAGEDAVERNMLQNRLQQESVPYDSTISNNGQHNDTRTSHFERDRIGSNLSTDTRDCGGGSRNASQIARGNPASYADYNLASTRQQSESNHLEHSRYYPGPQWHRGTADYTGQKNDLHQHMKTEDNHHRARYTITSHQTIGEPSRTTLSYGIKSSHPLWQERHPLHQSV